MLLAFSFGYALVRVVRPASGRQKLSWTPLLIAGAVIAVASFVVRLAVPLGEEVFRLALGQSPGWVLGFVLGCLGGERGWFDDIPPALARGCRRLGWGAALAMVGAIGVSVATGGGPEDFAGGANWPSLLLVFVEAALVIGMSIWLIDLFHRRFNQQGPLLQEMSRSAFAAFLVHQVVLVGAVLVTREVGWGPELEFLLACLLGIVGSLCAGVPGGADSRCLALRVTVAACTCGAGSDAGSFKAAKRAAILPQVRRAGWPVGDWEAEHVGSTHQDAREAG